MPDVTAAIEQVEDLLGKFVDITKWKGNYPPATEHFAQDSIRVSGGVDGPAGRLWVEFGYADDTGPHTVKASVKFDEPGTRGGDDVITFDGQDTEAEDFVIGHRTGMEGFGKFYARTVVEYKFTLGGEKKHIRFDGPV